MTLTISENAIIRRHDAEKIHTFSEIFLCSSDFDCLKQLALQASQQGIFSYQIKSGGNEEIRVGNWVGMVQIHKKLQIEILPKNTNNIAEARQSLLKMLRCLPHSPFKHISEVALSATNLPIFEVFVAAFINELDKVFSKGIAKNYQLQEEVSIFVKGKIKPQSWFPHQIICGFDTFTNNIPQNRLIKNTLQILLQHSQIANNQKKLQQFLHLFSDIPFSTKIAADLVQIQQHNRLWQHYERLLAWVQIFLNQQSSSIWLGNVQNLALLFPTERLFESYISAMLKKHLFGYEVSLQEKSKYLINNYLEQPKFGLKPDVVIRDAENCYVVDAKWKLLSKQGEGIEQSDLYQMYAYGKKYRAKSLFLIFPTNSRFLQAPEPFIYDDDLKLHIIAYNLSANAIEEVSKLQKHLI